MLADISTRLAGHDYIPAQPRVFRAFAYPPTHYRILILGQDPYPNPKHATGLAFSVPSDTKPLPKSLQNIFRELASDLNHPIRENGDLSDWEAQGVLLLNRVLTTEVGGSNAHLSLGWERFTRNVIEYLVTVGNLQIAILWGKSAATMAPVLECLEIIESAHPSPLSAYRGFFGSRPFSRANQYLTDRGYRAIQWD